MFKLKADEDIEFPGRFYEIEAVQEHMREELKNMADNVVKYLRERDNEVTKEVIDRIEDDIESEVYASVFEWFDTYGLEEAKEISKNLIERNIIRNTIDEIKEDKEIAEDD